MEYLPQVFYRQFGRGRGDAQPAETVLKRRGMVRHIWLKASGIMWSCRKCRFSARPVAPHAIELDRQASTAPGQDDGRLILWLDGVQQASLTSIDNDTHRIDMVRLGVVEGLDPGTKGTEHFDAFESRRQSYIGP